MVYLYLQLPMQSRIIEGYKRPFVAFFFYFTLDGKKDGKKEFDQFLFIRGTSYSQQYPRQKELGFILV